MQHETTRIDSSDTINCTPVPDWVEHQSYQSQLPENGQGFVGNGVCRLLHDNQVDLSGPELAWHYRTAQRVLTRAGAEHAAHFVAEFDPSYERLDVHFIRILRGEESIEHANPNAFQFFRRETNLERLALNGRQTASLLIPDVRVDDIMEISFTLYGSNPVLGGTYSSWAVFDCFNPWLAARHRLVRPLTRAISVKAINAPPEGEVTVKDGIEDSRWHINSQQRREAEEFTPPWLILRPALQYSEFESWNTIARLFAPFYESPYIPDELAKEIDQLAAEYDTPSARAAEWLRFVQQKLRYFALSLGQGGLVPRDLEAIWSSRFGDCKDAAQLYIAGARRLGLDACAAIVSTTHGPILDTVLPSPTLFDHCIVRLRLDGVTYWLDPTIPSQSGNLQTIVQPHTGWGLPLTLDTTQLEKLSSQPPLHFLHYEDEVRLGPKRDSIAKLRRHVDYSFWAADVMRNRIANEGSAEFAREMLRDLQTAWPDIVETEPLAIRDDPIRNCLTVTCNYDIADVWKQEKEGKNLGFNIVDNLMAGHLKTINGLQRHTDIDLGRPRKLTRRVCMQMPRKWIGDGWSRTHEMPGIRHSNRLTIDGRTINLSKELVIEAWSIPAAQVSTYNQLARELMANQTSIWARERFGKIGPPQAISWRFVFNILWFLFALIWIIPLLRAVRTP